MPLIKERLKYLSDAAEMVHFLFTEPAVPPADQIIPKKIDLAKTKEVLEAAKDYVAKVFELDHEGAEALAKEKAEALGIKLGDFMMPIRMAVTGSRVSPPLIGEDILSSRFGPDFGYDDLEIVDNRMSKIGKKAEMTKDKKELLEIGALKKIKEGLEQNIPVRKLDLTEDEIECVKSFNLITAKPIIYVANVSEDDIINGGNDYYNKVLEYAKNENSEVVMICAKIESELAELNDDDKMAFLNDLGITESGLDQLIKKTYSLLGLATFFTAGSDEVRAWTFKRGMKAPKCAGIIHTDFERGFIKAEVMSYDDLVKYGSEKDVKENGKMRLEGKEYEMQDGDICYFRFNV